MITMLTPCPLPGAYASQVMALADLDMVRRGLEDSLPRSSHARAYHDDRSNLASETEV